MTALPRSPLTRKTPLKRVSKKRSVEEAEYQRARKEVWKRSGGRCEVLSPHDRSGWMEHVHHRKFRSQGGSHSLDNLIGTCAEAHFLAHEGDRAQAIRWQLVVIGDEYPYGWKP